MFRFRAARAPAGTGDDASAFVKLLLEAAQQRELSIYVVPTMRSDFLGDCAQFQGLPEAINDGQYLIPRMTRDERRFAITGPVGVKRRKITEPLVNRLMNDVGDNPDQLPILQHALMRTWDYWAAHRRNGEPIGLEHYQAIGTMSEALSEHADEAWAELDERGQLIAEKLFKALTERGADNREIRRPTTLSAICEIAGASLAEVAAVIEVFRCGGRSFLMPPAGVALDSETVIDISHESLIRNWQRLQTWVNEDAQSARIYRRLAEAAVLHREGSEGLLQDPGLQIALDWRDQNQPTAAWAERYHPEFNEAIAYLEKSRDARDAALAERERQRREELQRERREREQAEQYAAGQARAARRLRWLVAAMAVMFLLALATAAYALTARADAERNRKAAQASLLTANAAKEQVENSYKDLKKAKDFADAQKTIADEKAKDAQAANKRTKVALDSQKQATARADTQKLIAVENARQGAAANKRGELIRGGLEAFRREDFNGALKSFQQLQDELKDIQPGRPTSHNMSPEQLKQFVTEYGWTWSHVGDSYYKLGQFDEAIKAYEQAREVLEGGLEDKSAPILFDTYYGLAHAYHDKANAPPRQLKPNNEEQFEKAKEFYKKALAYQEKYRSDQPLEAASGYQNLARLYTDIGQFDEAEKNYKRVVELYRGVEYRPVDGAIVALKQLAEFYRGQGRYKDAAKAYTDLLDTEESSDSERYAHDLTDTYSELGQIFSSLKDEARANALLVLAEKFQQVLLRSKQIQGKGRALNDSGLTFDVDFDDLGDAYVGAGRFAQAKEALHIRQTEVGRGEFLGLSYEKLAKLYRDHLKDYDKAEEFYKLLIEANYNYTDALTQLGVLYATELNKPAEAEQLLNRALATFSDENWHDWPDKDAIYSDLIDLYRRQNRQGERVYDLRLASLVELLNVFGSPSSMSRNFPSFEAKYVKAVDEVAGFYMERKKSAQAEAAYRLAFHVSEDIRQRVDTKLIADLASTLEEYQMLLRDLKKLDEAAKVGEAIKVLRTRQSDLEQIRQQQQIQQQIQQGPQSKPKTP